ncbi:MAG: PEGA domain-containing protein, partial [Thermoplasmata archaeon]|nr:PEGA domain-containing protein [Thermoplasmata archaeon]
ASVYVDGRAVSSPGGVFNVTLPIGTHSVEVTAPGFDALFENVTITQGKTVVVPLDLTRSPPASTSGGFGGIPLLYLAVIGVVVLAAVGVVAYYRARRPPTEEIDPTAAPELFPEEAEPAEMPAVDPEDVDPAFR